MFTESRERKIRLAILKTFANMADQSLTPLLLEILQSKEETEVIAALKALASCGTVEAMEHLYEIHQKGPSSPIRNEASHTMGAIQARLGGDKGWLSVTDMSGSQGGLSMTTEKERKEKK